MDSFLKDNKIFLTYLLIILMVVSIFGINFLITFIGNILLIFILTPILLLILGFIGFNSYTSKVTICNNCGAISLDLRENCINCGADLKDISKKNKIEKKPSESTIEIEAEEIK